MIADFLFFALIKFSPMTSAVCLNKFDIDEITMENFLEGKRNICLQFPDELLSLSSLVVQYLESRFSGNLYVMADTTFGSCCIDNVAGEHGSADGIIHFGSACLSTPSIGSPAVLWIFEKKILEIDRLFGSLNALKDLHLIFFDTAYSHVITILQDRLSSRPNLIWSDIRTQHDPSKQRDDTSHQGRTFCLPTGVEIKDTTLLYIGEESLTISNLIMTIPCSSVLRFDPISSLILEQDGQANTMIRKRFTMVQKAKDANTIGIVVGTLGVGK